MNYRVVYDPVALHEFKEAILWYIERSESAAENFIEEVKQHITLIGSDPLRYRITYKDFRETSLKKYPYSLVYLTDSNRSMIIIVSIYHHKRSLKRKYIKKK